MWHGATGGVGGGLSRSDKKEGRGRGHTRWRPGLCCPPSVVLLMSYVVCQRWRGKNSDRWGHKSRQQGVTEPDETLYLWWAGHSKTAAQAGVWSTGGSWCFEVKTSIYFQLFPGAIEETQRIFFFSPVIYNCTATWKPSAVVSSRIYQSSAWCHIVVQKRSKSQMWGKNPSVTATVSVESNPNQGRRNVRMRQKSWELIRPPSDTHLKEVAMTSKFTFNPTRLTGLPRSHQWDWKDWLIYRRNLSTIHQKLLRIRMHQHVLESLNKYI